MKNHYVLVLSMIAIFSIIVSCKETKNANAEPPVVLNYDSIVKEALHDTTTLGLSDSANLLDKAFYNPSDTGIQFLDSLAHILERDSSMIKAIGVNDSGILTASTEKIVALPANPSDSFSNNIKKINADEIKALKYNLSQLSRQDSAQKTKLANCKQASCRVWMQINKTTQRLYLHIDGKVVDTFKVSTGDNKHETPLFDMRPTGPIFQKYTSKKYPGGNYNGLGNMPYVIFIKGGYGIHGTTRGNIPKLGKKASHGCIRVHPDNGKVLNELVRKAGLQNTWITVEK